MFLLVIGAIIIIAIFLLVKARYIKHKLFWIFIFILVFFFYLSFVWSGISSNVDLTTFDGAKTAGAVYIAWLGNAFDNIKIITGNVINMDWNINKTKSPDSSKTPTKTTTKIPVKTTIKK